TRITERLARSQGPHWRVPQSRVECAGLARTSFAERHTHTSDARQAVRYCLSAAQLPLSVTGPLPSPKSAVQVVAPDMCETLTVPVNASGPLSSDNEIDCPSTFPSVTVPLTNPSGVLMPFVTHVT